MAPHKKWIRQLTQDDDNGKEKAWPPMMAYSYLFGGWTVVVLDPDIVREILTENATKAPLRFEKRYTFLQSIAGAGLATLEGEQWSRHRRIFQPCFQASVIRERLDTVVPPLVERFLQAWEIAAEREE